ncbi:MAG: DUF3387 domain-containing protein [Pseudomonadota bacterium]|nr:DUF3387 domain-containing protein [Pseudomonadota bacterium]
MTGRNREAGSAGCVQPPFGALRLSPNAPYSLANSLDAEQRRAAEEGICDDELALFDLLFSESISRRDMESRRRSRGARDRRASTGEAGDASRQSQPA